MKTMTTFLLTTFLLFLMSCSEADDISTSNNKMDMEELLIRSDKLQQNKEWDYVQNVYQDIKLTLQKHPQDNNSKLELAELFIREARITGEHGHYYPASLRLTNDILDNSDKPDLIFQALVTKSGVQLSLHEFEAALSTAKKALAINNSSAQIYGVLVDCYVELGDYDNAILMADQMMSIKPDIRSYSRVSYIRELYGDLTGAEEALTLAIKSGFPGYEETAWAMLTLGELYIGQSRYDEAEHLFNQILVTRPNYPFAIAAKAQLFYLQNNLKAAEQFLNESITVIPEVGFYIQLAQIYKDQNRKEEFDAILKDIFIMLEDDVQSGHNMNIEYANIYKDILSDYDKAFKYAVIEWQKRPNNIDVNRLMSQIELLRNKKSNAKRYRDLAAIINPNHPELLEITAAL